MKSRSSTIFICIRGNRKVCKHIHTIECYYIHLMFFVHNYLPRLLCK